MSDENKFNGITLVTPQALEYLNPRQEDAYRQHRKNIIQWMFTRGKHPEKLEGYARETIKTRASRVDKFYRWLWEQNKGYTERVTTDEADAFMKHLAKTDYSRSYKSCFQKAVKTLFKWRNWKSDAQIDWEPKITYSDASGSHQPRDFLSKEERQKLREASLEYGSIPHYHRLTPEERDKWKSHLAQRFNKPKEEVTKSDWEQANSYKIPSMIWVSMDTGLRAKEVGKAKVSWVDLDNSMLRIPKEDSTKNTENWTVAIQSRTAEMLKKWIEERRFIDKYSDTDLLWLTQYENPYRSQSLNQVILENLCDIAGIDRDKRGMTWYSIRHSVGTYMTREEGLAAAGDQLRHKSERTTMKYDQAPVEDRRDALDNMG